MLCFGSGIIIHRKLIAAKQRQFEVERQHFLEQKQGLEGTLSELQRSLQAHQEKLTQETGLRSSFESQASRVPRLRTAAK